jgi:hypothetical protein
MSCRKCGGKHTTKRRAGVFSCRRCGVQPGPYQMDRAGIPAPVKPQPTFQGPEQYEVKPWQPRLRGTPKPASDELT